MVGKVEDFLEVKRQRDEGHELSELDRIVIGKAVRIEIPFTDQHNMRHIADLLRGYAETLDFWSRRNDLPKRAILSHLRGEAAAMNVRIREMTGLKRGRGKNIRTMGRPTYLKSMGEDV